MKRICVQSCENCPFLTVTKSEQSIDGTCIHPDASYNNYIDIYRLYEIPEGCPLKLDDVVVELDK